MKTKRFFIGICVLQLFLFAQEAFSQEKWTLQKCIDHAMINNIRIKQSELNVELSQEKVIQNKADFLPSLNANSNSFYNFGRTIDRFTNQFVSDRTLNLNFSLSSSITLFNGFQM